MRRTCADGQCPASRRVKAMPVTGWQGSAYCHMEGRVYRRLVVHACLAHASIVRERLMSRHLPEYPTASIQPHGTSRSKPRTAIIQLCPLSLPRFHIPRFASGHRESVMSCPRAPDRDGTPRDAGLGGIFGGEGLGRIRPGRDKSGHLVWSFAVVPTSRYTRFDVRLRLCSSPEGLEHGCPAELRLACCNAGHLRHERHGCLICPP